MWRAFKLCGRLFSFDETGVVSAMYAPYERGVSLLNISTFVTNITLVEESEMETALDAFELPHIFARADGDPEAVLTLTLTLTLTLNVTVTVTLPLTLTLTR